MHLTTLTAAAHWTMASIERPDIAGERTVVFSSSIAIDAAWAPSPRIDLDAVELPPLETLMEVQPQEATVGRRRFVARSTNLPAESDQQRATPSDFTSDADSLAQDIDLNGAALAARPVPPNTPAASSIQPPVTTSVPQTAGNAELVLPEGVRNFPPSYPAVAMLRRWHGTVMLRMSIGTDGTVREAHVAQSSGHDVLDAAAVQAVSAWTFRPARRGGEPIPYVVRVPIVFKLGDKQ